MYKKQEEAEEFLQQLPQQSVAIGLAVPYTLIGPCTQIGAPCAIGAQNIAQVDSGAFTGEVALEMVQEQGARFALLGHQERRRHFGETDAMIGAKVTLCCQSTNFFPIICVGEEDKSTPDVHQAYVKKQVETILEHLPFPPEKLTFVYEPGWAIGGSQHPSSSDIEDMVATISETVDAHPAKPTHCYFLYGGAVSPTTAPLLHTSRLHGFLVGRQSLTPSSFLALAHWLEKNNPLALQSEGAL